MVRFIGERSWRRRWRLGLRPYARRAHRVVMQDQRRRHGRDSDFIDGLQWTCVAEGQRLLVIAVPLRFTPVHRASAILAGTCDRRRETGGTDRPCPSDQCNSNEQKEPSACQTIFPCQTLCVRDAGAPIAGCAVCPCRPTWHEASDVQIAYTRPALFALKTSRILTRARASRVSTAFSLIPRSAAV